MAKRAKITSKRDYKIVVTSKSYRIVSAKEFAKAIGAEIVTDPKEIAKLRKKFPQRS